MAQQLPPPLNVMGSNNMNSTGVAAAINNMSLPSRNAAKDTTNYCFICLQPENIHSGRIIECCKCRHAHSRCLLRGYKTYGQAIRTCDICYQDYRVPMDGIAPILNRFYLKINHAYYISPFVAFITLALLIVVLILLIGACSKLTECLQTAAVEDQRQLCPDLGSRNVYWQGVLSCVGFMMLFMLIAFWVVRQCRCCGFIPSYMAH